MPDAPVEFPPQEQSAKSNTAKQYINRLFTNKYYLINTHLSISCCSNDILGASGPCNGKSGFICGKSIGISFQTGEIHTFARLSSIKNHLGKGLL